MGFIALLLLLLMLVVLPPRAGGCVAFVKVAGVEVGPLVAAFVSGTGGRVIGNDLDALEAARDCALVTAITHPRKRVARACAATCDPSWRIARRRRFGRELRSVVVADVKFEALGVVEVPEATALLFDRVVPLTSGGSWFDALNETRALNSNNDDDHQGATSSSRGGLVGIPREEVDAYVAAFFTVKAEVPRSATTCPVEPHAGGYLWIHSYGYAPLEPILAEGVNGWRVIFARAVAIAKELGASVILPCARHSLLVPCGVPRSLVSPDPLGNSNDDDFVEEAVRRRGVDDKLADWLDIFYDDDLVDDDSQDDASRGVPRRSRVDDVSAYFDVEQLASFLGGAKPITVRCAAELATTYDTDIRHVRAKGVTVDDVRAVLTVTKNNTKALAIAKFGGGFDLSALRDAVPLEKVLAVEEGPLFGFAPRLHRDARDLRELLFGQDDDLRGGGGYAAVHWRAETLVARKDPLAPAAFVACADALLAAVKDRPRVVLVTDVPFDTVAIPSWVSFDTKLRAAHPLMKHELASFARRAQSLGLAKLDALLAKAPTDARRAIDLGDLAILEQILAVEADVLFTHYESERNVTAWQGVGFNDCGYSGRFMRTIITRRLHSGKPVLNWYPEDGFPALRSPAAHRMRRKPHVTRPPVADRLRNED